MNKITIYGKQIIFFICLLITMMLLSPLKADCNTPSTNTLTGADLLEGLPSLPADIYQTPVDMLDDHLRKEIIEQRVNWHNIMYSNDPTKADVNMQRISRAQRGTMLGSMTNLTLWPITRSMLFGIKNIKEAKEEQYKPDSAMWQLVTDTHKAAYAKLLKELNIPADKIDDYLNNDDLKKAVTKAIQQKRNEASLGFIIGAGLFGIRGTGAMVRAYSLSIPDENKITADISKIVDKWAIGSEENMNKLDILSNGVGLVGVTGPAKDQTIFTRTRTIGLLLLIFGFFIRVFFMIVANLISNKAWGGTNPVALVFKTFCLLVFILFIPNIGVWGLNLTDTVKGVLIDPSNKLGNLPSNYKVAILLTDNDQLIKLKSEALGGSSSMSLTDWLSGKLQHGVAWLCSVIVTAIAIVMIIMCDVMMGITLCIAPIIIPLSLIPSAEGWPGNIIKAWLTYLFYGPILVIFLLLMTALIAISLDMSFATFLTVSVAYIKMATKIPDMSESLSTATLTGAAAELSSMPAKVAKGAATAAGRGVLGAAGSLLKR